MRRAASTASAASAAPAAAAMADFRPPGAEPYDAALQTKLKDAIIAMGPSYIPRTHHLVGERAPKFANRLVLETSPYLLQHAHNPVNWFPWGDEAFAEAKRLKRPVFLSSGYSTCHWCHVMEEESFENVEIAEFLNSHYVCIKLDREERPDVDAIYMTAVQAIHGSGGWPMSVWLTDAREPFFAGTYFPPHDGRRGARVGFLSLLKNLADLYHKEPERVKSNASMLVDAIRGEMEAEGGPDMGNGDTPVDAAPIEKTVATVKRIFDHKNGGVRRAPKFPSNIPVRLLLRYHRRTGDAEALHMATLTLEKMAGGGMHDQLGGGFHRYSTDAEWLAPHFEKMLYDNALLAVAYAEAHQATGRADFARIVRMTLDYVLREMTSPEGGFYSATDADSEGEEGRFFVWSEEEVRTVLGSGPMTDRFVRFYDVTSGGNWEGHNILRTLHPDEAEWHALAAQRAALYEARSKRVPPLRDEKILASWNGLMISAMAIAGRILDESRYIQAAERALLFIVERMRVNGKIARSYKGGKVGASAGFLDDYAFVSAAALDLYEATLEKRWLLAAQAVAEEMQAMFGDAKSGGWFKTSLKEHEALIAREKSTSDGAEPAGASVALLTCVRLAAYTQRKEWSEAARRGLSAIGTLLNQQPLAVTEALLAIDYLTDSVLDIAIIWPDDRRSAAEALFGELRRHFVPNRAICGAAQSEIAEISKIVPWMAEKAAVRGAATAFVCESTGTCKLPAQTPADLAAALGAPKAYGARGAASAAASLH